MNSVGLAHALADDLEEGSGHCEWLSEINTTPGVNVFEVVTHEGERFLVKVQRVDDVAL